MHRITIIFYILALSSTTFAQKGRVTGNITAMESGKIQPMPFVNVLIKGTTYGATTDMDGNYSFNADPGDHVLQVSFVGFEPLERPVTIVAGSIVTADVELKAQGIELQEFEVVRTVDRERETMMLMERKQTTALIQNIGAQELKKKGASDVAEGVQKMVGMSTVGGRHVMVRGLGDRYNAAYLNGLPLPSPDPDMKVAPLDIIPTDVVGSISVTKGFSPELYGDFSGGAVDVATKRASGGSILKINVGGGMNTQSTFNEFRSSHGGGSDLWGLEDGTRAVPAGIAGKPGTLNGEVVPFRNNFNPRISTAAPDQQFGLYGGTRFSLGQGITLNVLGTASYRNEHRYRNGKIRIINASNMPLVDYDMESWQFNTQTSALAAATLELGRQHSIGVNGLWVNLSSDEHRINYGEHFDYLDDVYARRYTYRQKTLLTQQINGRHVFGWEDRLVVEWSGSLSTAEGLEPDRRQLVYLRDPNTGIVRFNAIDRLENHRWYSALDEEEKSARAGVAYRVIQKETEEGFISLLTLRAGAQMKRKERSFGYDIYSYNLQQLNALNPEGISLNDPDRYLGTAQYQAGEFTIANVTGPEAKHWIEQDINAAHASAEVDLLPNKLKLIGGLRIEEGGQRIIYRRQSDSFYQPMRVGRISSMDPLPFASVKFDVTKKDVVRASASRTISRPGFREMAPFEYTEFFAGTKNVGDPDLHNGTNHNFDLRYERFAVPGELIAVGVFGKQLMDPIEKVALATASGQLQSFRNTGSAHVVGIEFELVKNVGRLIKADSTTWSDLSVGMNFTLMHSELRIGDARENSNGADVVLTNDVRPLQGASPYLVNFDLTYMRPLANGRRATATLAYMVFGPRVFAAGANGLGDQYELPVHTLNLVLGADLGKNWQAGITFRNLLDARYRVEQETPDGASIINQYRVGMGISASISYRIL